MRALVRRNGFSVPLVFAGLLAPQAARAQAVSEAYPAQPGFQQYQQPPAQPHPYPQQPQTYPQQQPGYYEQPGSPDASVPGAPDPTHIPRHHGFLMLPYLGINLMLGDWSSAYSTSFRFGGILGVFIGTHVSLNGEISIDTMALNTGDSADWTDRQLGLTFSPLLHFGPPRLDFVFGPRVGYAYESITVSYKSLPDDTYRNTGAAWGFNTGILSLAGRTWLGFLLSFTTHKMSRSCETTYFTNYVESCRNLPAPYWGYADYHILTLNFAVML